MGEFRARCRLDSRGLMGRRLLVSSVCGFTFPDAPTWHFPADIKNGTSSTTHPNVVTFAVEGAVAELRFSVSVRLAVITSRVGGGSSGGGCHAQQWSILVIINSFWFLWKKKKRNGEMNLGFNCSLASGGSGLIPELYPQASASSSDNETLRWC